MDSRYLQVGLLSGAAVLASAALTWVGAVLLPGFRSREAKQGVYRPAGETGASSRLPLVGGAALMLAILPAGAAAGAVFGWRPTAGVFLAGLVFLGVGLADDLLKSTRGKGFDDRASFALAVLGALACATIVVWLATAKGWDSTLSLGHWVSGPLGAAAIFSWAFLLFLGTTVGSGVSDGIDGLTAGLTALAAAGIAAAGAFARVAAAAPAALVCGATVGFLLLNLPSGWTPLSRDRKRLARAYLGDSGALASGALLVAAGFAAGFDLLLPVFVGAMLLEGASSFIQAKVIVPLCRRFERFGGPDRRSVHHSEFPLPFVAAPLHHHLELVGMSRPRIVALFWTASVVTAGLGAWAAVMREAVPIAAAYVAAGAVLGTFWVVSSSFRPAFIKLEASGGVEELLFCHGRPRRIWGIRLFSVAERRAVRPGSVRAGSALVRTPMNPHRARLEFERLLSGAEPSPPNPDQAEG